MRICQDVRLIFHGNKLHSEVVRLKFSESAGGLQNGGILIRFDFYD